MGDSAARIFLVVERRKGCADRDAVVAIVRLGSRGRGVARRECRTAGRERDAARETEPAAEDPGQLARAAPARTQAVERADAQAEGQSARRSASAAAPQPDAPTRRPGRALPALRDNGIGRAAV